MQETLHNTEFSVLNRAVINVYLLQQDGKIVAAIEKWRSIANIATGVDDELASQAWFSAGKLLFETDPEEALLAYDKAIRLKLDNAIYYNNRGTTKSLLEQYESAISDYDEAIGLNPEYSGAYYNRGKAKMKLRNYE